MARHDTVNITCQVSAQPDNVTFKWQFNSSGAILELADTRAISEGTFSLLPYSPASPGDYGLLLCSASNLIGDQRAPCVINITEPSKYDDIKRLFFYLLTVYGACFSNKRNRTVTLLQDS